MRILHLEASTGWGGQEIRILQEAEAMRERGHLVFFVVMTGGILAVRAREAGFEVYEMSFYYKAWACALFRLLWIIHKHRIEIVNTHSSLDSWIGGIAARVAGKKIVRTRHLSTPVRSGWNSRTLYRTLADFVVTTCEAIIEPLSRQSGQPVQFFRSIATGVDPDKIQANLMKVGEFRQKMSAEQSFLVGTACFMRSWKGIEEFLQAAALLRRMQDVKWVVIGGGKSSYYREMANEMELDGIVYFTGHLENPFSGMAALDVFILLSTANEGVSQAILQAAFLKKPLIATPTGGLREVCVDQKTGFLVSPFCPREVADAVIKLQENPALREKMGAEAHALVTKRFTFKQTIDGMEEVYRTQLAK
jgi:glycosyltransferase involved in cell wall biosynthesis